MADVKSLTVDGTKYNIKDATARTNISTLTSSVNSLGDRVDDVEDAVDALETASANYVTLNTEQTITTYPKTFLAVGLRFKSNTIDNEVNPTDQQYLTPINVRDKNNKIVSGITFAKSPDGKNMIYLQPVGYNASKADPVVYGGALGISCNKDGTNTQATAPTPAITSLESDTNIATTGYINKKFKLVSELPPTPVSGVVYFIEE